MYVYLLLFFNKLQYFISKSQDTRVKRMKRQFQLSCHLSSTVVMVVRSNCTLRSSCCYSDKIQTHLSTT